MKILALNNSVVVGEQCEQVFPEHNIGYCNRNLYDCIGDDYVMPSKYENGSWYYPPPTDNDYPPAPNTYNKQVDESGQTVCYDFALKRTIDNDYCEDIGEDTGAPPPPEENLTEFGFPYCPPRVACVDSLVSSNNEEIITEQEEILPPPPIDQNNIGGEEDKQQGKEE